MRALAVLASAATGASFMFSGLGCNTVRIAGSDPPASAATVVVTPPSASVAVQHSVSLSAVVKDSGGAVLADRPVVWSSANPAIATVTSAGSVTGIAVGTTTVIATSDGRSGTCTISVTAIPVSSVEVTPEAATILIGQNLQLTAIAKDATNAALPDRSMAWSSSNPLIAKVSAAGLITAVAAGTAYVTATTEGKSDTSIILVAVWPVASVTVSPSSANVGTSQTLQLTATLRAANGTVLTGRQVAWTSSDIAVGSVSPAGLFTGILPGSVRITATSEGKSGSASLTVLAASPLVVNAGADQVVGVGASAALNATVTSTGPGPLRMFWSKVSGPGAATFSHASFNSSFEDGTVNEWTSWDQDGQGGSEVGGGSVSQERSHSGAYSWKGYNDPALPDPDYYSAKLIRCRFDYVTGYFSAWYYWPSEYVVSGSGGSVNILQFKERLGPGYPTWVVAVAGSIDGTGLDEFTLWDWHGNTGHSAAGAKVPKNRWFHLAVYQKVDRTNGELAVWVDGVRIFNLTGINTRGSEFNDDPNKLLCWGVGNYSPVAVGKFLYVDDAMVTDASLDPRTTSVRFSAPGTYVLRLTAGNATQTLSDDVQVIVR